ncbi:MAG: 50S ribosomal protein L21 [Nitrospiraceae bacterium]|nr:50S ribosomal protein L21 [Nitrospiraceae bacterium]
MYAVIETGGQQMKVVPGETIKVNKLASASGAEISIDKVLFVSRDSGVEIGKPYVQNASVKAEVIGDKRDRTVLVYKQKPRKGYRKLNGHRQSFTVLKIKDIVIGG